MVKRKLEKNAKKIDLFFRKFILKQKKTELIKPMKYGVLSGGKKIRSSIIISSGKIFNLAADSLLNICGAVECIHSYSLIHDDLPCMDNDKVRRGKPSTHVKFGEATAVLAGNSLLTLAFEMIADKNYKISNLSKNELIRNLSRFSGHNGIAGGQELDLRYEKKKKNLNQIIEMQKKKTGKLFNFCCLAPALIAKTSSTEKRRMSLIGEDIGLLFQLADDLLDITGSKKITGKTINKDKKKGKSTLVNLIGVKRTYEFANDLKTSILNKLNKYGAKANDLKKIIEFILARNF